MATVMTAAAAAKYKPSDERREIRDAGCPGLYLVVFPSGSKSWVLRFKKDGRAGKVTLGPFDPTGEHVPIEPRLGDPLTLAAARKLASDLNHQRATGKAPSASGTFAEAAREFIEQHSKPKVRRWETQARYLGFDRDLEMIPGGLAERWRNKRLDRIDGDDIYRIVDEVRRRGVPGLEARAEAGSDSRGRSFFAALSKLFSWLAQTRRVRVDPTAGVHPPPNSVPRDRVLTDDEVRAFWSACEGEPLGPVMKLMLLTGARLREVGQMTKAEIDGSTWTIPATRSKNRRPHTLVLPPMAMALIESADTWGVPTSKVKRRLDAKMGIPPWTLHDLRRTCATGMAGEIGIAPHIVEAVLNHVSGARAGVAGTYNRAAYAPEKKAALERWASHVASLIEGRNDTANVVPIRG